MTLSKLADDWSVGPEAKIPDRFRSISVAEKPQIQRVRPEIEKTPARLPKSDINHQDTILPGRGAESWKQKTVPPDEVVVHASRR